MYVKERSLFLLSIVGISCCSLAAENTIKLDEVSIIESSQINSDTSVNLDRAKKAQAKDLKNIFKDESSISIGNGKSKSTQRLYLRGIESTNLNITLDGTSQGANMFQHRGNIPQVNVDILKSVNVQTMGNAEKGKGALGGSISMTSKDAQDFAKDGKDVGGIISTSYSTIDNMKTGAFTVYGIFDKYYGIYLNTSEYDSDDYKTGGNAGTVLGTASKNKNYFFKFSMLEKDSHSLRISASKNNSEGLEGDDKGAPASSIYLNERDYIDLEQDSFTGEYRFNPDNSLIDITTNIYKTNIKEQSKAYSDGSISGYEKQTIGGKIKNRLLIDTENISNEFILGIDFSKDESNRNGGTPDYYSNKGNPVQARFITIESKNLGIFSQNTSYIDKLAIHYGARLDKYDLDIGDLQSIKGSEISSNIGFSYKLTPSLDIFANYSENSRATGIVPIGFLTHVADKTYFAKGLTNDAVWGNNIKPESSKRKELGIYFDDSNLFIEKDNTKLSFTYFDTKIEDLIEVYAGGRRGLAITGLKNSEDLVQTKGFEIKTSWQNEKWYTSLNYINAETTVNGIVEKVHLANRIAAPTGDKIVWYTNYQILSNLSLGYTLNAIDGIDYDDGKSMAGYTTHSMNINWEPINVKGLSLSFAVNNLTDKKYEDQSSTYYEDSSRVKFYEPGRDFKFSLEYSF